MGLGLEGRLGGRYYSKVTFEHGDHECKRVGFTHQSRWGTRKSGRIFYFCRGARSKSETPLGDCPSTRTEDSSKNSSRHHLGMRWRTLRPGVGKIGRASCRERV